MHIQVQVPTSKNNIQRDREREREFRSGSGGIGPLFAERAAVDPLVAPAIELEDVGNLKMFPIT